MARLISSVPWQMTLFVVVMLPVVISLGRWQLQRADEKAQLELAYDLASGQPAQHLTDPEPFVSVTLSGRYLEAQFLLDNQIDNGAVGYWVLQGFALDDGRRVLVNRGWIAAPPAREALPEAPPPQGPVQMSGVVWPQLGLPPLLAEDPWGEGYPQRVQRRNIERMAARIGGDAIEIRIGAGAPGVLKAVQQVPEFGRQTHLGYAFQWFGLAGVLVVGWAGAGHPRQQAGEQS